MLKALWAEVGTSEKEDPEDVMISEVPTKIRGVEELHGIMFLK